MARLPRSTRRKIQLAYARCRNASSVARKFHVDPKTVHHWIAKTNDDDPVSESAGRGRKPALDTAEARTAYKMLKSGKYNGALHVARELHKRSPSTTDKPAAKSTIIKHAKAYATSIGDCLVCDKRKPVQQLSVDCMAKRVQFCKDNMQRNWDNVMFTDRKRFYFMYPGSCVKPAVWKSKGQRQAAYRPSAPQCINLYCGITRYGATLCHFVSGTSGLKKKFKTKNDTYARNICSAEYYGVMMKTLLAGGDCIYKKHKVSSWVMQQDNDRSHGASSHTALSDYLQKHKKSKIEILPGWPANSPDLSPIENFWGSVQTQVNAMGCKTFLAYKRAVLKLIRDAPTEWFDNYYKTMRARLEECIANGGSRIQH